MKKHWTFWLGIVLALIGAGVIWQGNLLGERTIPAAIVIGIVGISLIATGSRKK